MRVVVKQRDKITKVSSTIVCSHNGLRSIISVAIRISIIIPLLACGCGFSWNNRDSNLNPHSLLGTAYTRLATSPAYIRNGKSSSSRYVHGRLKYTEYFTEVDRTSIPSHTLWHEVQYFNNPSLSRGYRYNLEMLIVVGRRSAERRQGFSWQCLPFSVFNSHSVIYRMTFGQELKPQAVRLLPVQRSTLNGSPVWKIQAIRDYRVGRGVIEKIALTYYLMRSNSRLLQMSQNVVTMYQGGYMDVSHLVLQYKVSSRRSLFKFPQACAGEHA